MLSRLRNLIACCAVLLALSAAPALANPSAVAVGEQYVGTPYAAYGLDCSGLTSMVYAQLGVYLPDSPAAQYAYGVPVASPAPGDLVFFNEGGYGISHVGIYVGGGLILHSSDYFGRVVISPMAYLAGYAGARRIY